MENSKAGIGAFAKSLFTQGLPDAASPRLASLDAYRGLVILMMIFVNYIGEMPGVPHWLKHATASEDTFTFPDLVFPGFLFMVGMAIPLAFWNKFDAPLWPTLRRILWRTVCLLGIGVLYENSSRYDAVHSLLPKPLFMTLFYFSVIGLWYHGKGKKPWHAAVAAGVILVLMLLFRGEVVDGYTGPYLEHTFWGILGLIGWAYLLCSLIYLLCRGSGTVLMGAMAFMLAMYMGDRAGRFDFLPLCIRNFVGIGAILGSTAANAMAGVIIGRLFIPGSPRPEPSAAAMHARRIVPMAVFAVAMIAAAILLRPFHGISKIGATESYTLIAAGINLLGFLAFYVILDVLKWRAWAAVLIPAGVNALFAYIIPDLWDQLTALAGVGKLWWKLAWPCLEQGGGAGIANGAVVSVFMLLLTLIATRAGLRLKA